MAEDFSTSIFGEDAASWRSAGEKTADIRWQFFLEEFAKHGADGFESWVKTSVKSFEATIGNLKQQGLSDDAILNFETAHWRQLMALVDTWISTIPTAA